MNTRTASDFELISIFVPTRFNSKFKSLSIKSRLKTGSLTRNYDLKISSWSIIKRSTAESKLILYNLSNKNRLSGPEFLVSKNYCIFYVIKIRDNGTFSDLQVLIPVEIMIDSIAIKYGLYHMVPLYIVYIIDFIWLHVIIMVLGGLKLKWSNKLLYGGLMS